MLRRYAFTSALSILMLSRAVPQGVRSTAHEERARDLRAPVSRGEISFALHQKAAGVEATIAHGADAYFLRAALRCNKMCEECQFSYFVK
jgi:hypothetical protein